MRKDKERFWLKGSRPPPYTFLCSNIEDSTFHHQPKAGGPPFLSRTGNVWHAFLRANIQELTFHQTNYCSRLQTIRWFRRSDWKSVGLPFRLKELRTFACFPLSQHRGFYFPPAAWKDRAVNSMEIKDFIILWTYSQWRQAIVVIPPFSPEREICDILLLSFIQTKWNQLSTDFVGPPFFQERSIVSHAFL